MESEVNAKETIPRWSEYENKIIIDMLNVQLAARKE
jgi:hypothetical protein